MQQAKRHSPIKKRILLGQLANLGDCLYATAIARQIKTDEPDCHLTWAIGSMCLPILYGNPFVDDIWEIPLKSGADVAPAWINFEKEARARKKRGDFDEIYLTQIFPNNFQNFDGTIRSSIFRGYPRPITVPVSPIIRLTDTEVQTVRRFAERHNLIGQKNVILFEYAAHSGQSFVTPEFAIDVSRRLIEKNPDTYIILSSHRSISTSDHHIIDGSVLSFRENAELTKYCSLLIGCSSGISWLSTSDWAKELPMVQLLKKEMSVYASFVHDYTYRKASVNHIIEMTECSPEYLATCLSRIINEGVPSARLKFHQDIPATFFYYCKILGGLVIQGKFTQALGSLRTTVNRYHWHPQLLKALLLSLLSAVILVPIKLTKEAGKHFSRGKDGIL